MWSMSSLTQCIVHGILPAAACRAYQPGRELGVVHTSRRVPKTEAASASRPSWVSACTRCSRTATVARGSPHTCWATHSSSATTGSASRLNPLLTSAAMMQGSPLNMSAELHLHQPCCRLLCQQFQWDQHGAMETSRHWQQTAFRQPQIGGNICGGTPTLGDTPSLLKTSLRMVE